tara:strand:+ start:597 stop:1397 length:801 start_codon:yes stop_codon:yes gene_type:complete
MADYPSDVTNPPTDTTIGTTTENLSPDRYTYTTDTKSEKFKDVPYTPVSQPKFDLSPPSTFIETTSDFCKKYPDHPNCHEEYNPHVELGFFSDENIDIFIPEKRGEVVKGKPINNLYEQKEDNTQLDVPQVQKTKCKCKNGKIVIGYINMRNGQKDCSNCNKKRTSYPNAYKNYRTKSKTRKTDIKKPLREQVGVSHFGDINMRGCSVESGTDRVSLSKNTLNKVVNISDNNNPKGSVITQKLNNKSLVPDGLSIYKNCSMDIYGI